MKKSNKLISILLAVVMLLTIAPISAFAATEAYQLNRDNYLECAYSENVTQYYRDNNYLYKATYSNLKNVAKVGIYFNYSYNLRFHYISSDGEKSGYASLYKSIYEVAKAGDLPKSPGATLSCLSDNEELYINKNKPVVTFTCLAVNTPVWTWNGTSSATAKFTSTDGKATMTVDATIESSVQPAANCLEKDKTVYTATATANGKAYTNEKTIYGEQGSHSFEYSGDDVIGRCTNGCGYECPHENQTGEICTICGGLTHKHSFVYTANGNVITVTCSNTDGYCNETNGGTLTISAPADLYTDGTISREAVIDNQLVEPVDYTVTYSTADGTAPKTSGTYTASVTIGGATASIEYTLVKRNAAADMFVFSAPANLVYDGTAKNATVEVSPEITGMGAVTVTYYKDGVAVDPVNAGTYTVKVSTAESDKYYALTDVEIGTFTISKKSVTATAIAPDKQYNGIGNIDKSKITIVLDGIVDGESVETVVETAWIEGEAVGENYLVPVFFSVSGDAAKNYSFPINELYPTDFYYAEATVNIYNDFAPKKGKEYTVNSNDWINTDFVITANEGYQLSLDNELNGWSDILSKSEETENGSITFYVINKETGAISLAVTENYKIDKTMPHGYFSDSRGRGYDYLLLDEIQTEPYYENEDIFTHKYEAWDDASGIANMEYYFSTTKLTKAELDCVSGWTEFDLDIDIEDIFEFPGDEIYSYIRVTDRAENTVYYVAHLVYDGEMARINGVLYGFTYYTTQIISVTDNLKLDYATVNGEVIKSGYNAITLTGNCDATYEIFAYDLAGNDRAEKAITMKPIATLSEPIDNIKEETVKSSDKKNIEAVKAKVEGIDTTDATESEKAELQEILDKCDALIKKISDIQAEIDVIGKTVAGYTEETVKSTDSADLEQLKEDIQALIDSTNTTENEKTALEEMINDIEGLENRIEEIEKQLEEIAGTENGYNPEKVTSDDKADIEEKIAEIESVNPDNLTEEQKAEYAEIKAGFEALLEEIEKAGSEVDAVGAELEMFDEERVTIFHEDEIEVLKAKIDELLADENMGETEKAKLGEYKAQCDNLIEIINTPAKYFSMRLFYFVWDALRWLSSGNVFIFN